MLKDHIDIVRGDHARPASRPVRIWNSVALASDVAPVIDQSADPEENPQAGKQEDQDALAERIAALGA